MVEYRDRLAWAMKRAGKTRNDVATRLNMSYQGVRKVLIGETNSFTAKNNDVAAAFLGVSSRWLASGHGRFDDALSVTNTATTVTVPLMTWEQIASAGGNLRTLQSTHEVRDWVATHGDVRPAAFALCVMNDAMVSPNPNDTSFAPGTIILIDPGEPASHGDYVLATDPNSQEPTFKRLAQDGGRWFLRPLNPSYPTSEIEDPHRSVLGRVFEYQLRRKL